MALELMLSSYVNLLPLAQLRVSPQYTRNYIFHAYTYLHIIEMRHHECVYGFLLFGVLIRLVIRANTTSSYDFMIKSMEKPELTSEASPHSETENGKKFNDVYAIKNSKNGDDVKVFFPHLDSYNYEYWYTYYGDFVVDKNEGRVYLCLHSIIYQLSPTLDYEAKVDEAWRGNDRLSTCAVLMIDYENGRLISCGGPNGFCNAYSLVNVSNILHRGVESVIEHRPNFTVAFVGYYLPINSSAPLSALYIGIFNQVRRKTDEKEIIQLDKVIIRTLQLDNYLSILGTVCLSDYYITSYGYRGRSYSSYGHYSIYGFSYGNVGYFIGNDLHDATTLTTIGHPNNLHPWNHQLLICADPKSTKEFSFDSAYSIKGTQRKDDALFVAFRGVDENENMNWRMCMYSMDEINGNVTDNITTEQLTSPQAIKGAFLFSTNFDYEFIVMTFPLLFSVSSINNHRIVFIGTMTGRVIKVHILENLTESYYAPPVTPQKIDHLSSLASTNKYFYLLINRKLMGIKVQNCDKYKIGRACLSFADPLCGWCFTSGKCCISTDCDAKRNITAWISRDAIENYITLSEWPMKTFSRTGRHNITMNLRNSFSFHNQTITCMFMFNDTFILNTVTTSVKNTINCTTPSPELLPSMPIHTHSISAQLLVMPHAFSYILKSSILVEFFDCSTYNSCTSCSTSPHLCNWNMNEYRCTHESHVNSNVSSIMHRKNPQYCPRFYPITGEPSLIFVPNMGKSYFIKQADNRNPTVKVQLSAPKSFSSSSFVCLFQVENDVVIVNATISYANIVDDMFFCIISCTEWELSYNEELPNATVEFSIKDNQSWSFLDNVSRMRIVLYECAHMGNTCETCVDHVEEIECGWCEEYRQCSLRTKEAHNCWRDSCTNHVTVSFKPNTGPWEGGTLVNISILISQPIHISSIFVAGELCFFDSQKFFLSTSENVVTEFYIECKIFRIKWKSHNSSGPVTLYTEEAATIQSTSNFHFVDPKIEDFSPTGGPKCGGTEVTFDGKHMNAGRKIQIFFDDLECAVVATHSNKLKCVTSPSNQTAKRKILVKFDGNIRTVVNPFFEYEGDMEPDNVIRKVPRGTPSGGVNILVMINDSSLLVQRIKLKVIAINGKNETNFFSTCQNFSSNQMICPSPVLKDIESFYSLQENEPTRLQYGFVMETENKTIDLNIIKLYPQFLLYPESVKPLLLGVKISEKTWPREYIGLTILVASVLVILVVIITITMYNKKSRKMRRRMDEMAIEAIAMSQCVKRVIVENEIELDENDCQILKLPNVAIVPMLVPKPTGYEGQDVEYELPEDDFWEFPRTNLSLGKCLGSGEFGKVVKGRAIGILEQSIVDTVAIKMLKNTHTDIDMVCLVSEMEMMKLIGRPGHENVLQLLGCCTRDGPLLVITEYAPHGNLLDFLRKHELANTNQLMPGQLDEKTLIAFAAQVAKGMEYLASMRCIHRDLAARNILVSRHNTMKIADFGLARDVRGKYYYQQKTSTRLPVRWMSPEAIIRHRNTIQSDVWSYGILLWEIMTLGDVPYASYVDVDKLIKDIKSGYRMEKPHHCSTRIYEVMRQCWNYQPENRPIFSSISTMLKEIVTNDAVSKPEEA